MAAEEPSAEMASLSLSEAEAAAAAEEAAEVEPMVDFDALPKFSLPILMTIKSAQRANGLLHSEYERYRL